MFEQGDFWYVSWDGEPHSHLVVDPPDHGKAIAMCGEAVPAGISLWDTLEGPPLDETCAKHLAGLDTIHRV